jgi:hypothetical protein
MEAVSVPLPADDSSGNVISLVAFRVGQRLRHPRDAVLPARSLATQLDLPYADVLHTVCQGYLRAAS